MKKLVHAVGIAVMALALSAEAMSQTATSTVTGRVSDLQGAVIRGAAVHLRSNSTGKELRTTTNDEGVYVFRGIEPGNHTLTVEVPGFKQYTRTLDIVVGASTTADIKLAVASHSEGVGIKLDRTETSASKPRETAPDATKEIEERIITAAVVATKEMEAAAVAAPDESDKQTKNYATVRVFYATDRRATGTQQPANFYGSSRVIDEALSYGVCEVSIPRDHRLAVLEAPSILRLEFKADPALHIVLLSVKERSYDGFFKALSKRVERSKGKEAFVFIHGYNVTFEDAARRVAQLSYDLSFDGAPILYSWPSQGGVSSYSADEATIEWTASHLQKFLEDIAARSHATTVHLIAHSMGNRALTRALNSIAMEQRSGPLPRFQQLILAAPDVDVGTFKQLAEGMKRTSDHITLYASSADKALGVSKWLHKFARVGDAGSGIVIFPGIDTIDVSALDTGFLSHSYFGDNKSVLSDICRLIKSGKPPNQRCGIVPKPEGAPEYYVFEPSLAAKCSALALKCPPDQ